MRDLVDGLWRPWSRVGGSGESSWDTWSKRLGFRVLGCVVYGLEFRVQGLELKSEVEV